MNVILNNYKKTAYTFFSDNNLIIKYILKLVQCIKNIYIFLFLSIKVLFFCLICIDNLYSLCTHPSVVYDTL